MYFFRKKDNPNVRIVAKEFKNKGSINVNNEDAELKEVGTLVNKYVLSVLGLDVVTYSKRQTRSTIRIFMEYCDGGDLKQLYENLWKQRRHIPEKVLFPSLFCFGFN